MKRRFTDAAHSTNRRALASLGHSTRVSQSPTGSIVEPSNPRAKQAWKEQHKTTAFPLWTIPVTIGLIIIVILLIILVSLSEPAKPAKETPSQDGSIITDDTVVDEELALNNYFYELSKDPGSSYMPDFSISKKYYSEPPTNILCSELVEVPRMNPTMLNLYLDNASVVIISGQWDYEFGEVSKAILIFGGSLADSIYNISPISCADSSDENLKHSETDLPEQYTGSEIFNNLSSKKHFYVWTDPIYINSGEE